jgi:hypothetical protein
LELVYERDLPDCAELIEPIIYTYDPNDGSLRDLFYLNADESLEPSAPQFRTPSKPYARIGVAFGEVESGLPPYAPLILKETLVSAAENVADTAPDVSSQTRQNGVSLLQDDIDDDDVIVGGAEHLDLIRASLEQAQSTLIIHSCFVTPETVRLLLPDFEKAAKRKVRIELLWGLHTDPEEPARRKPISDSEKVLNELPSQLRAHVQLSSVSSGSHAKIVLYDDIVTGRWTSIVGSCNFLSSEFDWIEASIRSRSQRLAAQLLGRLIAAQLPASGSWSPVASRLNRLWSPLRQEAEKQVESGSHELTLLADQDHYACVTKARDIANADIGIGCDLYGLAAETSVLVPMARAAETGRKVSLLYNRSSKFLRDEGREPTPAAIQQRGIAIESLPTLHAKFLFWDDNFLAITSFNWLSTVVDGARARGAELGLFVKGKAIRWIFARKLEQAINTNDRIRSGAEDQTERSTPDK